MACDGSDIQGGDGELCCAFPLFVCTAASVAPSFGNVSSVPGAEGPVISWEYWGPERKVYLEYVLKNSKHLLST